MATRSKPMAKKRSAARPSAKRAADSDDAAKLRSYLAAQPPGARRALKLLRDAIHAVARSGADGISYGIPVVRLEGRPFIWYAAWAKHVSLYPIGASVRKALGTALDRFEFSKGTIRFPYDDLPSSALVQRIARAQLAELRARGR